MPKSLEGRQKAFMELANMVTAEDLMNVAESSREFRENFALRSFKRTNKKKQKPSKGI
jgi:hypothetical protein